MRYLLTLLIVIFFISCKTDKNEKNTSKVGYNGALKDIMHKGDVSAKADLKDFKEDKHFYAIGAIENLKGEIQIFDSKPYITSVIDSTLVFDNSFDKKATLFVYASVNKWKSIPVPVNIETYKQLETFIEQTAKVNSINTDEPFPFLVEGLIKSFSWHVINWKDGDTEHSHEKHVTSGLHDTTKNRKGDLLGFYSNSHHAIFTHHTTNMHIHIKTNDGKIAGHVDDLLLGKGMTLKLPDTN